MTVETLVIQFDLPLRLEEVPNLRGALVASAGEDATVLMHDHQDDRLRYAYPLIQYKSIAGKAVVLCIGKGIEAAASLLASCNKRLRIGSRHEVIQVGAVRPQTSDFSVDGIYRYNICKWLPFNQENLIYYQNLHDQEVRQTLLEKILVGNILSCAKGLGIRFDEEVQVEIAKVSQPTIVECKHVKMKAFNVEFISNVHIPSLLGLGKHVSFGYGQITEIAKIPQ